MRPPRAPPRRRRDNRASDDDDAREPPQRRNHTRLRTVDARDERVVHNRAWPHDKREEGRIENGWRDRCPSFCFGTPHHRPRLIDRASHLGIIVVEVDVARERERDGRAHELGLLVEDLLDERLDHWEEVLHQRVLAGVGATRARGGGT